MGLESDLTSLLAAASLSVALSVVIEHLLVPRPPLRRPAAAWAVHVGLWCMAHALLTLVLGRPWFSVAVVSAFWLVLVQVNNAKYRSLREPFVFQDYEYFTDAIRYPRLYIPFLGWGKFLAAAVGVLLAVAVGLWAEPAPDDRWRWAGPLGGVVIVFLSGMALLWLGARHLPAAVFQPEDDLRALGFMACLWQYGRALNQPPALASPFESLVPADGASIHGASSAVFRGTETVTALSAVRGRFGADAPHLIAIQSESFFDPRSLSSQIRRDVLAEFDRLLADAMLVGSLTVPAWGANTIRTEFAFLSGVSADQLQGHRFNPYRAISAGWRVASLASWLKQQGYRTVCVHPYPAGFYQRNRVYPRLGFDDFLDLGAFAGLPHDGPYMEDAAVADKIAALLRDASQPLFVLAITMENHGPLHLEKVRPGDEAALYTEPPPPGCEDLTVYLRHLRNADRMVAALRGGLETLDHPASLCWYGDHVPILPQVYRRYGAPSGQVPYACWANWTSAPGQSVDLAAEDLSRQWLKGVGLMQ